jgi:hypothetical protein
MRVPQSRTLASTLLLLLFTGCGGGGGGGGGAASVTVDEIEPNDDAATAGLLALDEFGHGTVPDGSDTDFWMVDLAAGELVAIEVFANRMDQGGWSGGPNAARVTVLDTDGATVLLQQGALGFDWNADQDTDIHLFSAPAAGTYFLEIDVDDALLSGGEYLVTVSSTTLATPMQLELEPPGVSGANDSDLTAETIAPGTVSGFFVDDESDWYTFTLAQASLVTFTMHAHRSGVWQGDDSHYDSSIELLDSGLASLATNDDSFYLDSAIHHALTVPGTYFLKVGECCASGDSGYYLEFESTALAVTTEIEPNDSSGTAQTIQSGELVDADVVPGDDDFFAFVGSAGDAIQVEVFDSGNLQGALADVDVTLEDVAANVLPDDSGGELQTRRTILTGTGTFLVHVTSAGATEYMLRLTQTAARFESEPNDVLANADAFDAGGRAAGVIDSAADHDLFSFHAFRGVPVVLSCLADDVGPNGFPSLDGFGSELDPVLTIKSSSGAILASADSTLGTAVGVVDGLATVTLAFLPPASGTYYVDVADKAGNFGANFTFVLLQR